MTSPIGIDGLLEMQAKAPRLTRIYTLSDPRDGAVRYVGKTTQTLSKRLIQHMCIALTKRSHTYAARWIRELVKAGFAPIITQIEEASENWAERESYWIDWHWAHGDRLTNLTSGGEGVPGLAHSARSRAIMSEKAKIRFASPEQRVVAGLARRGKKDSPEMLIRKSIANKGRVHTEQSRANMSAAQIGKTHSAEAKANMSAAAKARRVNDPETDKRHSELMKVLNADPEYVARVNAVWSDPEYRAKRGAASKARCDNPEFRAKMSAIMTAEMARRKAVKAAQEASLERSDDLFGGNEVTRS
jgi:hypothetical protein